MLQKKKMDEEAQTLQHDGDLYLARIASLSIYRLYRSCTCYKFDLINELNSLQLVCVPVYSYSLQKISTDEEAQTTT